MWKHCRRSSLEVGVCHERRAARRRSSEHVTQLVMPPMARLLLSCNQDSLAYTADLGGTSGKDGKQVWLGSQDEMSRPRSAQSMLQYTHSCNDLFYRLVLHISILNNLPQVQAVHFCTVSG
jgi:hypothetical protein